MPDPTFNTIPQALKNGLETVKRADGAVWLDESKGLQNEKPGWFFQGGVRAPDSSDLNWHQLKNGAMSVRRSDGGVWMDESKGFNEAPGWYGQDGTKLPDVLPEDRDRAIAQRFGYDFNLIKSARNNLTGGYRPGMLSEIQDKRDAPEQGTRMGRFTHGVGDVGFAIEQLVNRLGEKTGRNNQGSVALAELVNKIQEEKYQQTKPQGFDAMRLAGNMVPSAVMLPGGSALQGGKAAIAGTLGKTAAIGAASALTQPANVTPTDGGQSDDYWKQKAIQAGTGALVAPVAQVGMEKVVAPAASKALSGIRTGISRALVGKVDPAAAAEAQALGDQFGVRLSAGDITGNPGTQKAEVALENLPFGGMGTFRKAQDVEAQKAVKSVADDLQQEMIKQGFDSLAKVKQAAQAGGKRGNAAKALLDAVDNAGDDWKLVLQTSGNTKLFGAKLKVDKAYQRVEDLSAAHGEVPLVNTMRAIEEAKRDLQSSALPDEATQKLVGILDRNLAREGETSAEAGVRRAAGGEGATVEATLPPQSAVDTSYSGMRNLRSSLGNKISDYYTGKNSVVGKEGVGLLERIKAAIERDMDEFAQSNGPELRDAWKNADSLYKTTVAPFKDRALATALADESPEKMARFFLSKGDPYTKSRIFQALDPKGQAALRSGLLQEALDAGTNAAKGTQAATFSPARTAGFLERNDDAVKTAFKGYDKWQIDGLQNLMRHVERAGQFAENPPTGNRMAQMAIGGGLFELGRISPMAAAGTWLTAKGLQQLYTTSAGKHFLLQASTLKPGSPAMERLVNHWMPKIAGVASAAPTPEEPQK